MAYRYGMNTTGEGEAVMKLMAFYFVIACFFPPVWFFLGPWMFAEAGSYTVDRCIDFKNWVVKKCSKKTKKKRISK